MISIKFKIEYKIFFTVCVLVLVFESFVSPKKNKFRDKSRTNWCKTRNVPWFFRPCTFQHMQLLTKTRQFTIAYYKRDNVVIINIIIIISPIISVPGLTTIFLFLFLGVKTSNSISEAIESSETIS